LGRGISHKICGGVFGSRQDKILGVPPASQQIAEGMCSGRDQTNNAASQQTNNKHQTNTRVINVIKVYQIQQFVDTAAPGTQTAISPF
jgi:hypothetical protein